MTDERRTRTHTDDVIDAMQRGVDIEVIRELGVFYQQFAELCYQRQYQSDGVYLTPHVHNLAKTILTDDLYQVIRDDTDAVIWECFMTIREQLTGYRETSINP
jgi:hypothetical protein